MRSSIIVKTTNPPSTCNTGRVLTTTHRRSGKGANLNIVPEDSARQISSKRKNPSKRLRFEVFKRDSFTCQYCGAQPPDAVLVCDHIDPVALGGQTTTDNLITACESCNQGKAAKPLGSRAVRPDADLMYLEVQQEIAELKRFQDAERQRDQILREIAEDLEGRWFDICEECAPSEETILQMLRKYSPGVVHDTILIVAKKAADRFFWGNSRGLTPYLWGVAKRVSAQKEEGDGQNETL